MKLSERMKRRIVAFMRTRDDPQVVPATVIEIEEWADEVAQLEAKVERLMEALDEISQLEPGNIDFCYEIANNALDQESKGMWLKAIENILGAGEARVIRELIEVVKYIELDGGDSIVYAPSGVIDAMKNLSEEAKAVIDALKSGGK
jgi:hypothetical protein